AARAAALAHGGRHRRMSDLTTAARAAVDAAMSNGADEADGWCEESTEREIRVYDGEVESLTDASSRGVGVRVFRGGRLGYAYGTDLSDEAVAALAREAGEAAGVADPDEYAGLPEEPGAADVDGLRSAELTNWSTERKVELALTVEKAARAHPDVTQ